VSVVLTGSFVKPLFFYGTTPNRRSSLGREADISVFRLHRDGGRSPIAIHERHRRLVTDRAISPDLVIVSTSLAPRFAYLSVNLRAS
jgi:hypothetical protein